MATTDKRTNGQADPVLRPFTFQDTGITIKTRKVSPVLLEEIRRAFPPPDPPLNTVEYEPGKPVQEPNPADPAYEKALAAHGEEINRRWQRLLIKRGVELDPAAIAESVAQVRADAKEIGLTLDPDDKYTYITCVAVGTYADLSDFFQAVQRRSMPTEEAIAEALEAFPGSAQGA